MIPIIQRDFSGFRRPEALQDDPEPVPLAPRGAFSNGHLQLGRLVLRVSIVEPHHTIPGGPFHAP